VNAASLHDLKTLPVGDIVAETILNERTKKGNFHQRIEELQSRVHGLGTKNLQKILALPWANETPLQV
jgi:DNA uptake protein ComE-like DNA-binding protein